jgi:hypothetical protein
MRHCVRNASSISTATPSPVIASLVCRFMTFSSACSPARGAREVVGLEVLSRSGTTKDPSRKLANRSGDAQWGILPSGCSRRGRALFSRRQHRRPQTHTLAALQNSWIWELLLVLALCAALAFFLIEVWQIVEFIYR